MDGIRRLLANEIGFNPVKWFGYAKRMRGLVREFNQSARSPDSGQSFVVAVTLWLSCGAPVFALAFGLMLAMRGHKVTFAIDDLPYGDKPLRHLFVTFCIKWGLRPLRGRLNVVYLSRFRSGDGLDDAGKQAIFATAHLNTVWTMRGETVKTGRKEIFDLFTRQLSTTFNAIAGLMRTNRHDALLVLSGIYSSSGLWVERARASGMRVASIDCGGTHATILSSDGIACHLDDIPRAFAVLKQRCSENEAERQMVVETAEAEIKRRRAGTDKFTSQIQAAGNSDPRYTGGILIALNSSWDGAALGLHTVFNSGAEWIVGTVRYLLENTVAPVIVRQHPAERFALAQTSDDYRKMLQVSFGDHPRLHFVAADDPINSYDLLEQVVAVVIYTSTFGVEATLHGKPVVTESSSYYSDLKFIWKGTSLKTYQALLSDAANGRLTVTPAMKADALTCYYLTQCRNWAVTPFNPADFAESDLTLAGLAADPKAVMMVDSVARNMPLPLLDHVACLAPDSVPGGSG